MDKSSEDDKSNTALQQLDRINQAVLQLRADTQNLTRLRDQSYVYIRQYQKDIDLLKEMKKRFSAMLESPPIPQEAAIPNPPPHPPAEPVQESNTLSHVDTQWKVESSNPKYTSQTINLRYSLSTNSVICSVQFNHDGSKFAFSDGRSVFVINTADGALTHTFEIPASSTPDPNQGNAHTRALRFSPDSKLIAITGPGNYITVFSFDNPKSVHTLDSHTNIVSSLVFMTTAPRLISGGFDGCLCVWDINNFSLILKKTHGEADASKSSKEDYIISLAIATDDSYLAVGFMSGSVGLYELSFAQPMNSFIAHQIPLLSVAINEDGNCLATGSNDKTIKIWALRGIASHQRTLQGHENFVLTLCFAPKSQILFSGSKDETIKAWNYKTGELLFTLRAHQNTLFQIHHHPTDNTFISCSGEGLVCLWDYKK